MISLPSAESAGHVFSGSTSLMKRLGPFPIPTAIPLAVTYTIVLPSALRRGSAAFSTMRSEAPVSGSTARMVVPRYGSFSSPSSADPGAVVTATKIRPLDATDGFGSWSGPPEAGSARAGRPALTGTLWSHAGQANISTPNRTPAGAMEVFMLCVLEWPAWYSQGTPIIVPFAPIWAQASPGGDPRRSPDTH